MQHPTAVDGQPLPVAAAVAVPVAAVDMSGGKPGAGGVPVAAPADVQVLTMPGTVRAGPAAAGAPLVSPGVGAAGVVTALGELQAPQRPVSLRLFHAAGGCPVFVPGAAADAPADVAASVSVAADGAVRTLLFCEGRGDGYAHVAFAVVGAVEPVAGHAEWSHAGNGFARLGGRLPGGVPRALLRSGSAWLPGVVCTASLPVALAAAHFPRELRVAAWGSARYYTLPALCGGCGGGGGGAPPGVTAAESSSGAAGYVVVTPSPWNDPTAKRVPLSMLLAGLVAGFAVVTGGVSLYLAAAAGGLAVLTAVYAFTSPMRAGRGVGRRVVF